MKRSEVRENKKDRTNEQSESERAKRANKIKKFLKKILWHDRRNAIGEEIEVEFCLNARSADGGAETPRGRRAAAKPAVVVTEIARSESERRRARASEAK